LRGQIASLRAASSPSAAQDQEALDQRLVALRAELGAKKKAVLAAQAEAARLAELKRKVETEVVYSMGTVEAMARQVADLLRMQERVDAQRAELDKALKKGKDSEEAKRAMQAMKETVAKATAAMPQAMSLVREIARMESSADKAARFYTTFLGEMQGFDDATRGQVEERFRTWVATLQGEGLAFPPRPRGAERKAWDTRRVAEASAFLSALSVEFPGKLEAKVPLSERFSDMIDFMDMLPPEDASR
jgi:hypothetical protein